MKTLPIIALACILSAPALSAAESSAEPKNEALRKVFSTEPQGTPAAIHKARSAAKPGETLTLKGRVMGNVKPFVDGRSIFILGDTEKLKACSDTPGDHCGTPWDNCCDSPEAIKQGTATIQVVDAKGKVLKEGIENLKGLKKLSHVVVSGKVAPASSSEVLIVNAEAIRIEKAAPAKR